MARPTNSEPFGTTPKRPRPLDEREYADMVAEWVDSTDEHDHYVLDSLTRWHIPAPWASRGTFYGGRQALVRSFRVDE